MLCSYAVVLKEGEEGAEFKLRNKSTSKLEVIVTMPLLRLGVQQREKRRRNKTRKNTSRRLQLFYKQGFLHLYTWLHSTRAKRM